MFASAISRQLWGTALVWGGNGQSFAFAARPDTRVFLNHAAGRIDIAHSVPAATMHNSIPHAGINVPRIRPIMGGFFWNASNLLAKPKFGLAMQ
jgi:hypothetical protein